MKILMITATFPPRKFGGITTVSYNLSKKLVERGHDVTVYTTDLGDHTNSRLKVYETENMDGIKIYYFKNFSNHLSYKYRLFLPLKMISKLKNNLNKFDIIHLHDFRSSLSIMVHYYAKKYEIPYILQAHGSVPYLSQKELMKTFFDKIWGHNLLQDATKLIALTNTEYKQYENMGVNKNKIEIIPNGINPNEYQNLPKKDQFKKKYDINFDDKIILYLGRLYNSKGIDLLITTFHELLKDIKNVKLIIVEPDDGNLNSLTKLVSNLRLTDKILFTGPLYGIKKLEAYIDANIFVTPSFSGFPMTFLEACACETPIITTNNGDVLDWINEVGCVVDYDDKELKQAIMKMLTNEELRIKFGKNGKKLVQQEFNWDKISKKVEEIYKNTQENLK